MPNLWSDYSKEKKKAQMNKTRVEKGDTITDTEKFI